MGRLEIRVCGARNIADTQKVGIPDPYVRVKMGRDKKTMIKYKTQIIDNDLNPTWNQLFKFQVADYDGTQIDLEVWNDNIFVDDLLGSYSLALNGLDRGVVKDVWVILNNAKRSSAELHLRILAVDFGRPPAPGTPITASIEQDGFVPPPSNKYKRNSKGSPPTSPIAQSAPTPMSAQEQMQHNIYADVQKPQVQLPAAEQQPVQGIPVQPAGQQTVYVQQQPPQIQYVQQPGVQVVYQQPQPLQMQYVQQPPQVQYVQPPVQYVQQPAYAMAPQQPQVIYQQPGVQYVQQPQMAYPGQQQVYYQQQW